MDPRPATHSAPASASRHLLARLEAGFADFETLLDRYQTLADPLSYHTAKRVVESLRLEVAEHTSDAETELLEVAERTERLSRALRGAIAEWLCERDADERHSVRP